MLFHRITILIVMFLALAGCTRYDVATPDTPANRAGFERHLKTTVSDAVTDVYYYADEMGADFRYQLSFSCDRETIDKIVESLELKPASVDYKGLAPRNDLDWWKPDSTDDKPLWIKEGKGHYFELWYSDVDSIALYHEYST